MKVAFEKANQKLEDKIVEIDPTLKDYVKDQPLTTSRIDTVKSNAVMKKPSEPKTHPIEEGESMSSIAKKYHVTVAELKTANPMVDEKKLQVGEKLIIPSHH